MAGALSWELNFLTCLAKAFHRLGTNPGLFGLLIFPVVSETQLLSETPGLRRRKPSWVAGKVFDSD